MILLLEFEKTIIKINIEPEGQSLKVNIILKLKKKDFSLVTHIMSGLSSVSIQELKVLGRSFFKKILNIII